MPHMSGGELALLTGLLSGGFALLGVGATTWNANRREDARFRRETALELAGTERLIWGDSWVELNVNLKRHETRLGIAGVPEDLIEAFHNVSVECWRDNQDSLERSGGEQSGIEIELGRTRRLVERAAESYLVARGKDEDREQPRVEAVTETERVLAEREARRAGG
jgi:hypothetical protein